MKAASVVLVSLLLGACTRHADEPQLNDVPRTGAEQPDGTPAAADPADTPSSAQAADSVRGTVVVTSMGPSSQATLTTGDGPPILLAGPLEPELRQLANADVTVVGVLSDRQRRSLEVQRYDIVGIDGARPLVGVVLPGGARLVAGSDTLSVVGQPEPLPAGAKVWIIGIRDGAELRLQSWGVIRR